MAHCYLELVPVKVGPDGSPASFVWRGKTYHVKEVLGRWHLMDRWWEQYVEDVKSPDTRIRTRANRYYWRVEVQDHMVMELYCDMARRRPVWVLDCIHD